ncbi:MAG: ABC transporter ATP-binding protein [Xanthobacteraceae bacterium]
MDGPALQIEALNKTFGALRVARDISLSLAAGARHALIGPNGAGKTTLVNLISGLLQPSSGSIRIGETDATRLSAERRVALGLIRTFQITSLFPKLTVAENVGLAVTARAGIAWRPWGELIRNKVVLEETAEHLQQLQLLAIAGQRIVELAYGQRRLVEIAVALAMRPRILLLDEPSAGLPLADRGALGDILMSLPDELTILLIEHDMSLVFRIAKHISVLVEGQVLAQGPAAEIRRDPRVMAVYLGSRSHG